MNNIEKIRKKLNISINDLCKSVGICRKTYYLYTVKNKPIPSDKLIMLSECLNCSIDDLLGLSFLS